jgi:hypothetical protein
MKNIEDDKKKVPVEKVWREVDAKNNKGKRRGRKRERDDKYFKKGHEKI